LPTAILTVGIMLTAILSFVTGLVLSNTGIGQWEVKRLAYLMHNDQLSSLRSKLESENNK
jgi:cytochrome b subunit of formate dehydrogenase